MKLCRVSRGCVASRAFRRFVVELFEHGYTERVEGVGGFMILAALIVAEERKDQQSAIGSFRITRARAYMLDGAGLCVNASGGDRGSHAVFERAVNAGDGQRREIRTEPWLRLRVLQKRYDGAGRDQIVA